MMCPHCSVAFFEDWSQPVVAVINEDALSGRGISWVVSPACGELIIRQVDGELDSDDEFDSDLDPNRFTTTLIYPRNIETEIAEEIPESLRNDFIEAKKLLSISPKASAAMTRRLLQTILSEGLGVAGTNLSKQIDIVLERSDIPHHISSAVDAVRQVGNFASHPIKETSGGTIVDVEPGEAEWSIETISALLNFVYVQPKRIEKRRRELNSKLRDMGKPQLKG